jgi:hypothetical protein
MTTGAVFRPAFRSARLAALLGLTLLLATTAAPPVRADDAEARRIMKQVNDRDDGDNQTADLEMTLIDRGGNRRERSIRSSRKDRGPDTLSLQVFVSPADVKGTGFLTYDYDASGKDDDQWLFLPALRKTKRIASTDKSGSFMGSDFNFSDLTEPDLEDYDYTLVKEEDVDGQRTWQIQAVPRRVEVAENTGYAKSMLWVRKDNHVVVRGVRWVHNSSRLKFLQAKRLEQIDGIWVATELQMVTREGRDTVHATLLRFNNVRFEQPLDESLFTVRQLEKGS